MSDKEFKEWLDKNFSEAKGAPSLEFQKISARLHRESKLSKFDTASLCFFLASVLLAIFVVTFAKTPLTTSSVTKSEASDLLHADEDLYRDFDVSLEHLDKILNSSRQM